MPDATQFKTLRVQAALLNLDPEKFSQPRFLATVLSEYAGRYDGNVETIPVPSDAPSVFPRVVLRSSDGAWRVVARPARIDSYWQSISREEDTTEKVAQCAEVIEQYVRNTPPHHVARLALVISRFCVFPSPARDLIDRYCSGETRAGLFSQSESFEIHNHRVCHLGEIPINSWVRCRTGTVGPERESAILVEEDINTCTTYDGEFDADALLPFLQDAEKETSRLLRLYFPKER